MPKRTSEVEKKDQVSGADIKPVNPFQRYEFRKRTVNRPHITIKEETQGDKIVFKENPIKEDETKTFNSPPKMKKSPMKSIKFNDNWEPINWQEMYENIKKMRAKVEAPVDSMDGSYYEGKAKPSRNERFYVLFALMLSSRTNDIQTAAVMRRLREKGMDLEYVLKKTESELANEIKSVNYYRTKAKHIKQTAIILKEKFGGDVPKTLDDLLSLPGVGMKMSLLALQEAWNMNAGIAVDTHVHRIANYYNWVRTPTKEAEHTRQHLESWVPKELWPGFNRDLVAFGQMICMPKNPKCEECLNNKLCPVAFKFNKASDKKTKKKQVS